MIDYYDILGVSPNASHEIVQQAYRQEIAKYRPEQFHSRYKQYATQKSKLLNDAYEVLSDPVKRRRYDMQLGQATRIPSKNPLQIFQPVLKVAGIVLLIFITWNIGLVVIKAVIASEALRIIIALVLVAIAALLLFKRKNAIKIQKR